MIVQLMSDLHLEGRSYAKFVDELDPSGVDVLVLAGDIGVCKDENNYYNILKKFCDKYPQVVMTTGNHEYYGSYTFEVDAFLDKLEIPNLHVLQNNSCNIDGRVFYGGTMWYGPTPGNKNYRDLLNDARLIKGFTNYDYDQQEQFVKYLAIQPHVDVVVSHHLPHPRCIDHKFVMSSTNRFFMWDMSKQIKEHRPKYWFHGHTHCPVNIQVDETRILCNPLGYGRENPHFNKKLLVHV